MKKNLPITDHEVSLQEDSVITSATDLKGRIRYVNREFIEISGFSEEELLGKSQNIVRHPDMPPAAFADLWQTIQAGRPWMGIVKNRCKNGDYYWVDSYVTPLLDNGEVTGYESTRVKADEATHRRAERLYQSLWKGKRNWLGWLQKLGFIQRISIAVALLPSILASILFSLGVLGLEATVSVYAAAAMATLVVMFMGRPLTSAVHETKSIVDNPLMQYVYTGRYDEVGQLQMVIRLAQAKARTGFKRVEQMMEQLTQRAGNMASTLEDSNAEIQQQQALTEQVAAAINEMTSSVSEVAGNTTNAAEASHNATEQSRAGALTVTEAIGIIESLSSDIMAAQNDIQQLSEDSETIGEVLGVIKGIAEQTNLLALNAAIEAARAGEQGRGFAVVADEVRTLATRTQESTVKIQQIIEKLQQGVGSTVDQMSNVSRRADECVEQVESSAEALAEISGAIQIINDMNAQIATATKEQASVVDEVNTTIQTINMQAQNTASAMDLAARTGHEMAQQTSELSELVTQLEERR